MNDIDKALRLATFYFGPTARVACEVQADEHGHVWLCSVGRVAGSEFRVLGEGATWEEAFGDAGIT